MTGPLDIIQAKASAVLPGRVVVTYRETGDQLVMSAEQADYLGRALLDAAREAYAERRRLAALETEAS